MSCVPFVVVVLVGALLLKHVQCSPGTKYTDARRAEFRNAVARELATMRPERLAARERVDCTSDKCLCSAGGAEFYGRYCGLGHYSCNMSTAPCDAMDTCCQTHDACCTALGKRACPCHLAAESCMECVYVGIKYEGRRPSSSGWVCPDTLTAIVRTAAALHYVTQECF